MLRPLQPELPKPAAAAVSRRWQDRDVIEALRETVRPGPAGDFWLVSFGAGFSAHSCRLGPSHDQTH